MRAAYMEHIYECGDYVEIDIYPVFKTHPKHRRARWRETTETQQRLNEENAARKVVRLANINFTSKDIRFDLTYDPEHLPPTAKEAQHQMQLFIRRVKRARARLGLPDLKYIAVTEEPENGGRYHHHIIMSGGMDVNDLSEMWGMGYTSVKPLRFDKHGIRDLASYIVKGKILNKHWCASQNLVRPVERIRTAKIAQYKVKVLVREAESASEEFERLYATEYPGFRFASVRTADNEVNGFGYITLRLYDPARLHSRCGSKGGQQ